MKTLFIFHFLIIFNILNSFFVKRLLKELEGLIEITDMYQDLIDKKAQKPPPPRFENYNS